MNALFIYPKPNEKKHARFGFSLNIAYASSILKQKGFNTSLIDLSVETIDISLIIQFIKKNNIHYVFFEFDSFALNRASNEKNGIILLKTIKQECPNVIKIAFGYECVLEGKNIEFADYTITGDLFSYLMNFERIKSKPSLSDLDLTYNYDSIPFPDRELFEKIGYYSRNIYSTLIQTSRGCLNSCTFCQRKGWQNSVQYHSDEYTCKEMMLLKNHGYKNIWVQDENFTFNLTRAKRILKIWIDSNITSGMKIAISSWTKIDKEFLELAALANIKIISMGVESANKVVLDFYKKDIDLDNVKSLISYADSLGIFTVGNFIIGAPMEDLTMIKNTFSFINESGFDQVNIKTLDYMIGSKLYESLPRDRYPKTHYFCCKENKLGQMCLNDLQKIKNSFLEDYRKKFKQRLENKILKYGFPYNQIVR